MTRSQVAASARVAAEEALDRMRGEKFEPTGEQFKPSTINHAVAVRDTHFADLLDEIDRWETDDSGGQGGGPRRFGYALLLLGMILAAGNNMPMWATSIVEALWYKIPEDRHAELGIPPLPACTAEGCSGKGCRHPFEAAARTVRTRLRSLERLVDPWGYPINQRLTPDELDARCRVYAPGERDRNYRRLIWLMNQVVEAALRQAPRELMDSWDGSATVDETPIRANARMPRTVEDKTKPKRNGRYTRKIERHSTDPSAGLYVRDTKVMHAWNLTMVVMAPGVSDDGLLLRPSLCLAVAPLALPGTGAADAALNACHDTASRGRPVTFLSNDRLYTNSRPELYQHPAMVELGISFIHDYRYDQLGTQDTYGGLILVEGGVYCADMPDSLINAVKDYRDGLIDFDTCRARVAERAGYAARLKETPGPDGRERFTCPAAGTCPTATCSHKPVPVTIGTKTRRTITVTNNAAQTGPDGTTAAPVFCGQDSHILPADVAMRWAKYRQPLPYYSDQWITRYRSGRSTMEGHNGFAKDPGHENLEEAGRRRMRGGALNSIFVAFLVYAANVRKIRSFIDHAEVTCTPSGRWVIHRPRKRNGTGEITPPRVRTPRHLHGDDP